MKATLHFILSLLVALSPSLSLAAACCLGGGPKSFIELRELQTYQIGLSTSIRDVFGRYDPYGELVRAGKDQTFTTSLGVGTRLLENLNGFLILPWVYRQTQSAGDGATSGNIGDILVGGEWIVLRSLFYDDWYPTISISAGVTAPTGSIDAISNGKVVPGTGAGIWQPYLGLNFQKRYGFVVLNFNSSYTARLSRTVATDPALPQVTVKEGDIIQLTESATFVLSRRFSIGAGSTQEWDLPRHINGQTVADSQSRIPSAFLSSSYFFTQYWSITGSFQSAIPFAKLGLNQDASRSLTLTSVYSFY